MTGEHNDGMAGGFLGQLLAPFLTLSVPLLFLSTAIRVEMNSLGLYARGFQVYEVAQVTGLSRESLLLAAAKLISYFNSMLDTPQMLVTNTFGARFELFHDYELIHLADVKLLFAANSVAQSLSLLLVTTLVAAGLTFGRRFDTLAALRRGAMLTLVLLVATALMFVADFGHMFTVFHQVAFDNPFWLLNPLTDYLVMLFPFGFWQDMFLFAGTATGIGAVLLFLVTTRAMRAPQPFRYTQSTKEPHKA
ncbi:MAG: TIGR01906 family membrane protein [Dehalococcoidia bacterium]|nr:TIGR01906 family membrane protein [Dehalococcoidia bacterium]